MMSVRPTTKYGLVVPGSDYLISLLRQGSVSREAQKRLKWMDHYLRHGNARLTCRYYGISPQTFYRWWDRFDPYDLRTLEARSRRPVHVRRPQTKPEVVERIRGLRERYPRWGKDKLAVLLKREGIEVSASTVGRVIHRLKASGRLREPVNTIVARRARKKRCKPRYAVRKPKGYKIREPGDLVEVDTLTITLLPGVRRYQFSARDVLFRFDAMRAYKYQSTLKTAHFFHYLRKSFLSPSKPSRSMAAQSLNSSLNRHVNKPASSSSCSPPDHPSSTGM